MKMKKLNFLMVAALFAGLFACSEKEDPTPLKAAFEMEASGETVPVTVELKNNSTGATAYVWNFEGGTSETSIEENPTVVFETPGTYTISLTASNATDQNKTEQTITVKRSNELVSYSDVKLFGSGRHEADGTVFSTETGKVYAGSELEEGNELFLDIAFIQISGMRFFESPDKVGTNGFVDYTIPNGSSTKFTNYVTDELNAAQFDAMTDDELFQSMEITHDQNAFEGEDGAIVLFQNAKGQKGALKVKELVRGTDGYNVFDVKMQKYPEAGI